MVKKQVSFKVKKVPLEYYPERYMASFPSMPILYLELLENKQKVKKDLRNKEYVPPVDRVEMANVQVPTTYQAEQQPSTNTDEDFKLKEYEDDNTIMKKVRGKNLKILDLTEVSTSQNEPERIEKREYFNESSDNKEMTENTEPVEEPPSHNNNEEESKQVDEEVRQSTKNDEDEEIRRRLEQRFSKIKEEYKSRSRESTPNDSQDRKVMLTEKYENIQKQLELKNPKETPTKNYEESYSERIDEEKVERVLEQKNEEIEENIQTDTQKKLADMFSKTNEPTYSYQSTRMNDTTTIRSEPQKDNVFIPPTLSQINNGVVRDNKGVRDITKGVTKQEEDDDAEKRLYLDKFAILKRKYKEFKVPEFSQYSDLNTIKKTYESAIKQLHLDSTVETYKKYLIGGFSLTQWALKKFLKIDSDGFATQQILSMNQYESILVEIGEKSYFKGPSSLPPEIKLLMLIGFNAVLFIISKMIFKASGDNILSAINSENEKKSHQPQQQQQQKPHMKGPSMDDLSDIENQIKKSKRD